MAKNRKCLKHNSVGARKVQKTSRVKNPGKQRKRLFNAPAHIRHKLMSAPLSNELAASRGAKTLPVRKGDTVRIQRGDHKGFEGKVSRVDLQEYRIYLEGLTREKVDGTNIFLPIHPSKVEIRNLNLDDKIRKATLERKQAVAKPEKEQKPKAKSAKKTAEKPKTKIEEIAEEPAEEATPEITEEAPVDKKAPAKKPATKKTVAKKQAPAKESKGAKGKTSKETEQGGQ
jgi:large subunit ribosomal protein L24